MARTITRKNYPFLWWGLAAAAAIVVAGLVLSGVFGSLDDPENYEIQVPKMIGFFVAAFVVAFLPLAFPRREVIEVKLPTDHLHEASRTELQGILEQLEKAKAQGEIPEERYQKAKARVLAEMGSKKA